MESAPRAPVLGGRRGSGLFGLSPALLGSGGGSGGYIRRAVLAGASLAVLRGHGSLSVFVLLLLHLLHDFPDLALGSLEGKARNGAEPHQALEHQAKHEGFCDK